MYNQFVSRPGVNPGAGRRVPFAAFHKIALLILCVCLGCTPHADATVPCPAIVVSAIADTGTTSNHLVTTADITDATAAQNDGQWGLNVNITDAAAKRVHDFSAQHVGQTMALVVDGKVQGTPKIVDTINAKGFLIGRFSRADAERMATAIHNGCKK